MLLPPRLQIATMKFPFRISYPALTYTDKGRQDRKISPKVRVFHPDLVPGDSDDEVLIPCPSSTIACPFVRPCPAPQAGGQCPLGYG
jgi:hypothetical protein